MTVRGDFQITIKVEQMKKVANKGKSTLGVLLLIVGSFLLAGNLGFISDEIYHTFLRWPSILILIGVFQMFRKDFGSGLIVFSIGIFFLLPHLYEGFHFRDLFRYWPVLLIIAGVVFIFGKKSMHLHRMGITDSKEDLIDVVSIFGGGVTKINSDNFQGGEITCIFGGEEVNLQGAKMNANGAVIDLTTIFGGAKITIPRDWSVKVDVLSIFGGFSDKRMYEADSESEGKVLTIKGVAIFGGGELRNF